VLITLKLKLLFGIILLEKNMAKIKKDFNFKKEINNRFLDIYRLGLL